MFKKIRDFFTGGTSKVSTTETKQANFGSAMPNRPLGGSSSSTRRSSSSSSSRRSSNNGSSGFYIPYGESGMGSYGSPSSFGDSSSCDSGSSSSSSSSSSDGGGCGGGD